MGLFSEFKESSKEEWEEKILKDLKGKPLSSLIWESEVGDVNPILFDTKIEQADPNQYPYTRGNKTVNNAWDIRQQFSGKEKSLNKVILQALQGGVNAIEILDATDLVFEEVFKDVQLDIIKIYVHVNAENIDTVVYSFKLYCDKLSYNTKTISGGLIFDPISELTQSGKLKFNEKAIFTLKEFKINFPLMNTFGVDASIYGNAGANVDTQIANALAHGHEYLVQRQSSGEGVKEIVESIEFTFAIGTSYFLEIAKIRAFRTLWATIVNEYDNSLTSFIIKINGVSSNINYTRQDKYNNLLRATTGAMSAVIAGVNSYSVLPFDFNEEKESASFGNRLAKNIQILLQEEAYLNQVIDPAGGSYYIEELTQKIQESSWNEFQEIEEQGGIMESIIQGTLQAKIKVQFEEKLRQLKTEEKVMVGVNKFVDENQELGQLNLEKELSGNIVEVIKSKRLASSFEVK